MWYEFVFRIKSVLRILGSLNRCVNLLGWLSLLKVMGEWWRIVIRFLLFIIFFILRMVLENGFSVGKFLMMRREFFLMSFSVEMSLLGE